MAEKEYIERERIEKFFDGIYDCADLTFEPNDHCCSADDCCHCKWYEAKNAIQKRILSIPAADVRPVVRGKWKDAYTGCVCSECNMEFNYNDNCTETFNYCPNCGAMMKGANILRWIPTTERLPARGTNVLVVEFGKVELAYTTPYTSSGSLCWVVINGGCYHQVNDKECPIKWWMPLPEPPKEK